MIAMTQTLMTEKRAAELLLDYVDGTLDAEMTAAFERFVADNAGFRAFVATYRTTLELTKRALEQNVPPDAEQRTLNFLRSHLSSSKVD